MFQNPGFSEPSESEFQIASRCNKYPALKFFTASEFTPEFFFPFHPISEGDPNFGSRRFSGGRQLPPWLSGVNSLVVQLSGVKTRPERPVVLSNHFFSF